MTDPFWSEQCPDRGPALSHAHWGDCRTGSVHPGTSDRHLADQCCHCEHTPTSARMERAYELAEAGVAPDDKPLLLPQGIEDCGMRLHDTISILTPKIGDEGLVWPTCPRCHQQCEPKLATGGPIGPYWGIGRGWVSPRMRWKWEAIAFRLKGLPG